MKQPQHIPTLLALVLLTIGMIGATFLVEKGTTFFTQAHQDISPQTVVISNISDSSFSVSWTTDTKTYGVVNFYAGNQTKQTAFDDREKDSIGKYETHHVTLRGLQPTTTYFFSIRSNSTLFENKGNPYQTQTAAPIVDKPPFTPPVSGTVKTSDDQPGQNVLVYARISSTQMISTITRSDGRFVLPLAGIRNESLNRNAALSPDSLIELTLQGEDQIKSTVQTPLLNTTPLPTIVLGKNYVFPNRLEGKRDKKNKDWFSFVRPNLISPVFADYLIGITQPTENSGIPSQKPEFRGTGVPNHEVIATVGNPIQVGRITVDTNGNWSWVPPLLLSPDSYLLTITTTTQTNQPVALSRAFTILKSGSSVLQAATPSATPKVSASPSSTPISTASASPSATPKAIPVSGTLFPTMSLLIFGMLSMGVGVFFLAL